jgi:hypothetical protein
MTAIVNTFWGGRISQVVDRQVSLRWPNGTYTKADPSANKVLVVLARDALASFSYTGVAAAHRQWMDCQIATCLAHRQLADALIQPGSPYLARPIYTIVKELCLNLNGRLNSDAGARIEDITISVIGWHLGQRYRPFAWELSRGRREENGMRCFGLSTSSNRVGKFLREHPNGLWGETLGNPGNPIDGALQGLAETEGMNHDDIEFCFRDAFRARAAETVTVGADCLAIQLDPRFEEWQVRVTYYPSSETAEQSPVLSPWVMTSRLICAPTIASSNYSPTSECGRYVLGGFEDVNTNLKVQTRLPIENSQTGRGIRYAAQARNRAP